VDGSAVTRACGTRLHASAVSKRRGIVASPFLYPEQTFHVPSRKFFENEVFKSSREREFGEEDIVRRCCVLFIRDYAKGTPALRGRHAVGRGCGNRLARRSFWRYRCSPPGMPEGFAPEDVYVCESRYRDNSREMLPIKNWVACLPQSLRDPERLHPPLTLYVALRENQGFPGSPSMPLIHGRLGCRSRQRSPPRPLRRIVPSVFAPPETASPGSASHGKRKRQPGYGERSTTPHSGRAVQ